MTRKTTLLVVDNHPEFAEKVRSFLTPQFEVLRTVYDGQSALDAARELRPDVVLLDIEMPGLNGFQAARLLRADGSPSKIIFLTMHNDPDYVNSAVQIGAEGFVFKSSVSSDLVHAIEEVIANRTFISRPGLQRQMPSQ